MSGYILKNTFLACLKELVQDGYALPRPPGVAQDVASISTHAMGTHVLALCAVPGTDPGDDVLRSYKTPRTAAQAILEGNVLPSRHFVEGLAELMQLDPQRREELLAARDEMAPYSLAGKEAPYKEALARIFNNPDDKTQQFHRQNLRKAHFLDADRQRLLALCGLETPVTVDALLAHGLTPPQTPQSAADALTRAGDTGNGESVRDAAHDGKRDNGAVL